MKHGRLNVFMLIPLVSCFAIAQAQVPGSDSTRHAAASGSSGMTPARESSWEGWINHGARGVTPRSQVPPRSPDLGRATAPLSPAIGPGSGLLGPESGRGPSRLRSNTESELGSGSTADRARR
jgi:hypothetical protein